MQATFAWARVRHGAHLLIKLRLSSSGRQGKGYLSLNAGGKDPVEPGRKYRGCDEAKAGKGDESDHGHLQHRTQGRCE